MIVKGLILAALVKLLISVDKPFLCASLYAFVILAMGFLSVQTGQLTYVQLLIATAISFGAASVFFLLLSRTDGGLWWATLALGVAALLMLT